jgi:hypothetical protein
MKLVQKMYSLFVWYIFKTAAIKKKVTMVSKHTLVQISLYPSNFTNTTSWAKELGAIALPTFKN